MGPIVGDPSKATPPVQTANKVLNFSKVKFTFEFEKSNVSSNFKAQILVGFIRLMTSKIEWVIYLVPF